MERMFRRTLLRLAIEYFLLVLPIFIYVSLEAVHHSDLIYLLKSPEWSIATIFIVIQTVHIHIDSISGDWNKAFTALLIILLGVIALAAGVNIYVGLDNVDKQSAWTMITKWGLYLLSSLLFLYIAGAGIFTEERGD